MKNIWDTIIDALKNLFDGEISDVDLSAKLDETAKGRNLNWRESVVDFLGLIGVDSSLENRGELGKELGVVGVNGTAEYNEALRKALFKKLADSGGNVPQSLLD